MKKNFCAQPHILLIVEYTVPLTIYMPIIRNNRRKKIFKIKLQYGASLCMSGCIILDRSSITISHGRIVNGQSEEHFIDYYTLKKLHFTNRL